MPFIFERFLQDEMTALLSPLANADANNARRFMASLGWDLDALSGLDVAALLAVCTAIKDALVELASEGDEGILDAAMKIASVTKEIERLGQSFRTWTPPASLPADVAYLIPEDILNGLVDSYLVRKHPIIRAALALLGLLAEDSQPAIMNGDRIVRRGGVRPGMRFDRLPDLFSSPVTYLDSLIRDPAGGMLSAERIADVVFPILASLLEDIGIDANYGNFVRGTPDPSQSANFDVAQHLLITNIWIPSDVDGQRTYSLQRIVMGIVSDPDSSGPALLLATSGDVEITVDRPVARVVTAFNQVANPILIGLGGTRTTEGGTSDIPPPAFQIRLQAPGTASTNPALCVGSDGSLQFIVKAVSASVELVTEKTLDVRIGLTVSGMGIVLAGKGLDSFLASKLPAQKIALGADLGLTFSLRRGIRLTGGAEGERIFPVGFDNSLVRIAPVVARLRVDDTGISVGVFASAALRIGPVQATVDSLGIHIALVAEPRAGKMSGPLALHFGISGPRGISLAVNAGPIVGGGFIAFDFDKQQYSGILQLCIQNTIDIKAIGILNARLPDGRPGFSLLLIITGEFPAIQLGMGFTLNGVGGLIGINRTAVVEVLRGGLRNGGMDSILFPPDPLSNVPALLNTLGSVFPVAEGRYVFGPMVRIGWGSPTILTLDLALILEIPDPVRLIILGRLKATLPDEKNAVVQIRMDAIGVLDFSRGELSLDATLYDSRILTFTITGDMALRLSWGAEPNFILSVGGFHPHFPAPVGLTKLARLAIVLIDREQDGIAARVRLESYLALTSNTAQFGARVDIYFKALGVEAVGFLGFDVLFHFVPTLSLEAALTAAVALSFNGVMLMGADLALTLTGPDPWHLFGAAHFVFLGLKLSGPVDLKIGEATDPPPPMEPVKVLDLLVEALRDPRNWQPRVPDGAEGIVMLRIAEGDDMSKTRPLMVHPLGSLAVRQCVVPLAVGITRYGNAPVQGETYFDLDVVSSGALVEDLTEQFAMGQYQEMRDDEKLAARSFDGGKAGVRFHTNRFASASTLRETASLNYEISSVLAPEPDMAPLAAPEAGLALVLATDRKPPGADLAQMNHFIALGAAAKAPTRAKGKARYFAATTCQ